MPSRADVVAEARLWKGTPYQHQASLRGVACDCLGLVRGVYRGLYGDEPETPPAYTRDWAEARGEETLAQGALRHLIPVSDKNARPGDVLLFAIHENAPAKHCAILTEPGRMIHSIESHPVAEVSLWRGAPRRLRYVFSFPGLTD